MRRWLIAALMLASAGAHADDYPPGLFERSPEINPGDKPPELSCDMQHQCYHMDPAHPDKVTPPPAPEYATPAPPSVAPAEPFVAQSAPSEDPDDPQSCFNLRRGIFATPEAAAHARAICH
jgi:hypothetical protein